MWEGVVPQTTRVQDGTFIPSKVQGKVDFKLRVLNAYKGI